MVRLMSEIKIIEKLQEYCIDSAFPKMFLWTYTPEYDAKLRDFDF